MLSVTNLKVSLKVLPICLDTVCSNAEISQTNFKRYNNFVVIQDNFTYIIFKNKIGFNTHVNITKIKKFEDIEESKTYFSENFLTCLNSKIISHKIDNITASYDLKKTINIFQVIEKFKDICEVRYNNETFPGVFLKHKLGTIIVFHSGKTIIIGSKDLSKLQCLIQFLTANI